MIPMGNPARDARAAIRACTTMAWKRLVDFFHSYFFPIPILRRAIRFPCDK
jgi:hypothetical protein